MPKFHVDDLSKDLAINGGLPVRSKEWLGNFTTGDEEIEAARRAIESGYLSKFEGSFTPDPPFSFDGGPEVQKLEQLWSEYYEIKHSVSMNSATSGLFASIGALGIGFGDDVIVSPYTMTAAAAAPLIYGAIPVFADVDPNSGCLDPKSIEKAITPATRAIIVVHQFGFAANMREINQIAKRYDLRIIEDCAQAHGATFNGQPVGTFGDIGIFSLNVNKTIQAGEGAVCVTHNEDLCYRLKLIRNHGEAVVGPAEYREITNILGFNYRMTEVTAAIVTEQLKKLDRLNENRLRLVEHVRSKLAKFSFLEPLSGNEACFRCACTSELACHNTYYVFAMRFVSKDININREKFLELLCKEGILFSAGYTPPLYMQPMYLEKRLFKFGYPFSARENQNLGQQYQAGLCPNAEKLHYEELLLNEYVRPPHTISDMDDLIVAINKLFN